MRGRSAIVDITDALFELLKAKELSQISVTELIQKADVCRASFYRNFYLIEDVIRKYGSAMYEEINRTIPLHRNGIYEHIQAVTCYLYTERERLGLIEERGLYHLRVPAPAPGCAGQPIPGRVLCRRYHAADPGMGPQQLCGISGGDVPDHLYPAEP